MFCVSAPLAGQHIVIREGGDHASAAIIRDAVASPHVVRTGTGRFDLPGDTSLVSTLIVLGRPTYLASKVHGDVIVIGGDLYVHPGADISGRAVAIGGSVVPSALARIGGGTESFRDETYTSVLANGDYALTYQAIGTKDPVPVVAYAGLQGLLIPHYDRVDGLSLPIGAVVTLANGGLILEPRVTYRSRLGVVDPRIDLSLRPDATFGVDASASRDTRSNDAWIRSDLINSATALFAGSDVRNYFRANGGNARLVYRAHAPGRVLSSFAGARYEHVEAITAAGNVFSFLGRTSLEKMQRPNPFVESGTIGSALLGAELYDTSGVVLSRLRGLIERSTQTPAGTAGFTQLTLDARVAFPTFRTQSLAFKAHYITTASARTPAARFAYVGGSGTLAVLENLEVGGDEVAFLESEYTYPLENVKLPFVGSPVLNFRHAMGSGGIGKLPDFEQEVGVGIGLKLVHVDFFQDISGNRGSKVGFGLSLTL